MNIRSFIFGASGFAKEVEWLIYEANKHNKNLYQLESFVVSDADLYNYENYLWHDLNVISETMFMNICETSIEQIACFIAIGSSKVREKIAHKISNLERVFFPNLIAPDVAWDSRSDYVKMGKGNIICSGTRITTDIVFGDFIHVNLNCTVGHESKIEDFVTMAPGVHISGLVNLGRHVYIGTGAVVLQQINIIDHTVVGAAAMICKSINESGTYVGVPAKMIVKRGD